MDAYEITDDFVEMIEDDIDQAHDTWGNCNPKEIIAAVLSNYDAVRPMVEQPMANNCGRMETILTCFVVAWCSLLGFLAFVLFGGTPDLMDAIIEQIRSGPKPEL